MPALRTILLSSDLSPESAAAFPVALDLARLAGAKLVLVTVNDEIPALRAVHRDTRGVLSAKELESAVRQIRDRAREDLAALASSHGIAGAEIVVLEGTAPAKEILRFAKERDVDLLVLATHGRGGLPHALLGSTAERVVRESPRPVLTVRCRA